METFNKYKHIFKELWNINFKNVFEWLLNPYGINNLILHLMPELYVIYNFFGHR